MALAHSSSHTGPGAAPGHHPAAAPQAGPAVSCTDTGRPDRATTMAPRTRPLGAGSGVGALMLALTLGLCGQPASAGPPVWGYGVKSCRDFLSAAPGDGTPSAVAGAEYARYREWLAGFVTALNLATASDVLAGAELDAALTSIRTRCQSRPGDDFFNASMSLIRSLGRPKPKPKAKE